MDSRITELETYKNTLINKNKLDNGSITINELSLEEIEDLKKQYQQEIINIDSDIQVLAQENKRLKRILENK